MQAENSKDLILGVFVLAISIGGFLLINPSNAPVAEGPGGVTWRTLPFIYSGLLFLFACLFLGHTILRRRLLSSPDPAGETENLLDAGAESIPQGSHWPDARRAILRRIAIVVLLIAYSQALSAFGFAISTPAFLFAVLFAFGKTDLVQNALVSVVGGLALWFLFSFLLKIPLDGGTWDPLTPALHHLIRSAGAEL